MERRRRLRTTLDGVLVIDKPAGPTSHDIVATARRVLGQREIGHSGTLDPNATGVLVLVLGRATRLVQHLVADEKEYLATIRFGIETDTYDGQGATVAESGRVPSRESIERALPAFRGVMQQTPPVFSAKKIASEPAYARARRSAPVSLKAAEVTVLSLVLERFDAPLAVIRLACSSGFYVRSLAHDLGQALECGAILQELDRTRAGGFLKESALAFRDLATGDKLAVSRHIIPLEELLTDFPAVQLTPELARWVKNGRDLPAGPEIGTAAKVIRLIGPDGRLVGLARPAKTPGFLHPAVVLS
jgi:tRNA pseudouridine55 synthase